MSTTTTTRTATTADLQVRIQLSTRDASIEFPEKPGPILVATNLRRYALSTLCNTLLESETPIPFEFLINGQFLRTSLDDFLTENGISAETTLNVEYIRAQLPPSHQASFEHDDWVSSVDVLSQSSPAGTWSQKSIPSGQERILSASYDGLLRIWDMSGNLLTTSPSTPSATGTTQKLLTTKWLSPTSLVSAGWHHNIRLWSYDERNSSTMGIPSASIRPTLDLYGHTLPINSLAVHTPSSRILSASADHTAKLWSSSSSSSDGAPPAPTNLLPAAFTSSSKRRKLSSTTSIAAAPHTAGALATLSGHTSPVRDVIFHPNDHTVAYTASSDRTFRTWDLVTSACVSTRAPASHVPLASLCALKELGLVALGTTTSRSVLLVDPREGGGQGGRAVVMTLRGHRGDVVSLAADPVSHFGLASGGHDGCVRVWDVRSAGGGGGMGLGDSGDGGNPGGVIGGEGKVGSATFRIPRRTDERCDAVVGGEGVKVFGLCWDREVGIVSGGEDKMVQIDKSG